MRTDRKTIFTILLFGTLVLGSSSSVFAGTNVVLEVCVDPRVELMCTIARLAGFEEYTSNEFPKYVDDVKAHFEPFKDHAAVHVLSNARAKGVGFEKVMQMAIAINNVKEMKEIIRFDSPNSPLSSNWNVDRAREFLVEARKFVKDSRFEEFYNSHKELYTQAEERFASAIARCKITDWITEYFGSGPLGKFEVIIGLQIGWNNYGATIAPIESPETIYSFIGVYSTDSNGIPVFQGDISGTINHELSHAFVNPLVYKFENELRAAGANIYSLVEEKMLPQSYGDWRIVLCESLVRAVGVRRKLWKWSQREADIARFEEEERGFYWMERLVERLAEYESNRESFGTFESYFPRIVEFINEYGSNAVHNVAFFQKAKAEEHAKLVANSPKIVSITPSDGETVSPETDKVVVVFSERMATGYGLFTRQKNMGEAPKSNGNCYWDSTGTVFTWPIKLQPNKSYGFALNHKWSLTFMAEDGDPLAPITINFKTSPQ